MVIAAAQSERAVGVIIYLFCVIFAFIRSPSGLFCLGRWWTIVLFRKQWASVAADDYLYTYSINCDNFTIRIVFTIIIGTHFVHWLIFGKPTGLSIPLYFAQHR